MSVRTVETKTDKPLCTAVADYLVPLARKTPSRAIALDHILVAVPTAEAGRRLRMALARRFKALVPPRVMEPRRLLETCDENEPAVATSGEVRATLAKIVLEEPPSSYPALFPRSAHLAARSDPLQPPVSAANRFERAYSAALPIAKVFESLLDAAIGPEEVLRKLEKERSGQPLPPDEELERWRELAALHSHLSETLRKHGATPPLEAIRKVVRNGPALPASVERIVLPAPLDAPQSFFDSLAAVSGSIDIDILAPPPPDGFTATQSWDEWGRASFAPDSPWMVPGAVCLPLRDCDIRRSPDSKTQALEACAAFLGGNPVETAFGMLDKELLPAVEAAFLLHGVAVRDPATRPLRETALGAAVCCAGTMLQENPPSSAGADFLRLPDVRAALDAQSVDSTKALSELDECIKAHIPRRWDELGAFARRDGRTDLLAAIEAADKLRAPPDGSDRGDARHLFSVLARIFKGKTLSGDDPLDRAFAAAAEAIRNAAKTSESPVLSGMLSIKEKNALLGLLVRSAKYSADENPEAVPLLGWLEIPWCEEPTLILSGFDEKCVPSAPAQDSFLPDSLRRVLRLQCSDSRYARDLALFKSILTCRKPGAVKVFTEKFTAKSDARMPSRLLFCCPDESLGPRALSLFRETPTRPRLPPGTVPEAWRLKLPLPSSRACAQPRVRISTSRFKTYLASPLQYFLENVVGDPKRTGKTPTEIPANDFGTLCHAALEDFANDRKMRDSTSADEIEEYLVAKIDSRFDDAWRAFADAPLPVSMRLQRDAARARMRSFAIVQAKTAAEGWRIIAAETSLTVEISGCEVVGKADRIDRNEETGALRVIDYKTWSKVASTTHKPCSVKPPPGLGSKPDIAMSFADPAKKNGRLWWHDLQLPMYAIMHGAAAAAYFVLGDSLEETGFSGAFPGVGNVLGELSADAIQAARATASEICARINAGLFAEPGLLSEDWDGFVASKDPLGSIDSGWLADQATRLARFENSGGGVRR